MSSDVGYYTYVLIKVLKEGVEFELRRQILQKIANELNVKKSSVLRQFNRIESFYENRSSQKRSGRKSLALFNALCKQLNLLFPPIVGRVHGKARTIMFDKFKDAMNYRSPVDSMSVLEYDAKNKKWIVKIPDDSGDIEFLC